MSVTCFGPFAATTQRSSLSERCRRACAWDLRDAAVALKIEEQRIGTHSLRIAGATWMYQAGVDIEIIKRHGRWTSGVVHVYLWEGSGHAGLAAKMAVVDFALHAHTRSGR